MAANGFGPLRTRYGTTRDLIVGVTLVRADGVVARGGGKVVKNVAGFDLPRLMVGSLGTLGLIATATFRLHPLPEVVETVVFTDLAAAGVRRLAAQIRESQLEPAAVGAVGIGPFDVGLRFEGFGAAVIAQRDKLLDIGRRSGGGCGLLDEKDGRAFWARHDAIRTAGTLRAKFAAPPSELETVAQEVIAPLASAIGEAGGVTYPTLGLGFVSGAPASAAPIAAIGAARAALARLGGSLVIHASPAALRADLDVWGAPPPAIGLMRSLKAQMDPSQRLGPGRFVDGI